MMIEDEEAAHPSLQPAVVVDLVRSKRIGIFTSASPESVASAPKVRQ